MEEKKCKDCIWYVNAGFLHCKKSGCNFNHDKFESRDKKQIKPIKKSNEKKEN